jgi:O-antigen/teichoic acid export membrane protein
VTGGRTTPQPESSPPLADRVARNTGLRIAAELAGKLAGILLFAVMARELGRQGFGNFTFVTTLGLLVTMLGGLGSDDILPRAVATGEANVERVTWDAMGLKAVCGLVLLAAALGISLAGGYETEVTVTLVLVGVASLIDLFTATFAAVFQGLSDLAPEAMGRTLQLSLRAAVGIGVLLEGGGIVALGLVYLGTSVVGFTYLAWVTRSRTRISLRLPEGAGARALATASIPIGVSLAINAAVLGLDTVILSVLKGNDAVGLFGAGQRLVESTAFLGAAFAAAVVPVLAKAARCGSRALAATYEDGCKVITSVLLPVSLAFVLFSGWLTQLVFGDSFSPAAAGVRILAPTVVLVAISTLSLYALISAHKQRLVPWIAAVTLLQNLAVVFLLVPSHSFRGAAVALLAADITYAVAMVTLVVRETGSLSPTRVLAGPLAGCGAMAVAAALVGVGAAGFAVAAVAYPLVWLAYERRRNPSDIPLLLRIGQRTTRD